MADKSTPINKIRQVPTEPSDQFAEASLAPPTQTQSQQVFDPLQVPVPSGQGQGFNTIENFTNKYPDKLMLLVFVIMLLLSSTPFVTMISSVPKLGSEGRLSIMGTVVISIIGSVLFQLIRYVL